MSWFADTLIVFNASNMVHIKNALYPTRFFTTPQYFIAFVHSLLHIWIHKSTLPTLVVQLNAHQLVDLDI
jgi:hypothetical protein